MKPFSFKLLFRTGTSHAQTPLDRRRIVLFNYLIFFCVITSFILGVITVSFGLYIQPLLCFIAAVLLSFSFLMNAYGEVRFSKAYFITLSVIMIAGASIIYIQAKQDVDLENMLFAAMAITMFLVDGIKKHVVYWLIFACFICLKVFSLNALGVEGTTFGLAIINNVVVAAVLYLFLYAFRSILIKAFDRSDQQELTLRSLLDNAPLLMALVDVDGNFILVNNNYAGRFGFKRRELIGRNRREVLPDHIFEKHEPMFQEVLKTKSQVSFLEETNLPDGSIISANGKYEPILNAAGKIESVAICVDDVSELVRAHRALKVANETKDKLFSIIAHDIKSPLNLFHSILSLNHDDVISKEQFIEYQESLKERLTSLTGTVDELLEWARMQLGGISAYPAKVNVSSVVQENADLFHTLIQKKNIDFKIDTPSEMEAWIDENHFKVAIRNLIHNAIKYTNGGGIINVVGNQNESETIVKIKDSGVGMSAERINSIIKKEIQKSKVGTDQRNGIGSWT